MLTIKDFNPKPHEELQTNLASFLYCCEWPTVLMEEIRLFDNTAKFEAHIQACGCATSSDNSSVTGVCARCRGLGFWYRYGCILDNFI